MVFAIVSIAALAIFMVNEREFQLQRRLEQSVNRDGGFCLYNDYDWDREERTFVSLTRPKVHTVVLRNVKIEDDRLMSLADLSGLKILDIQGSTYSEAVIREIVCSRPELTIVR